MGAAEIQMAAQVTKPKSTVRIVGQISLGCHNKERVLELIFTAWVGDVLARTPIQEMSRICFPNNFQDLRLPPGLKTRPLDPHLYQKLSQFSWRFLHLRNLRILDLPR